MKLAFFLSDFPKLSETFILNQIKGFIDLGHEVDIYAGWKSKEEDIHEDVIYYNLISRIFYYGNLLSFLKKGGVLPSLLNIYLRLKLWAFFLNSKSSFGNRRKFSLRPKKYDVIICHFGPNGYNALLLKDAGFFDGKIVVFFHGFDMSKIFRLKGERFYSQLFQRADLLLPISEFWKNRFLRLGYDSKKIKVHRMGIDCDKFKLSEKSVREEIEIISVSRLVEKKGLEYSIKTVTRLMEKHNNLRYTIIGDGPLRKSLQGLIDQLGVADKIKMLGNKRQHEIVSFVSRADIFLSSSVTAADGDMEGIPVSIMEAMACGIPVVVTDHSGTSELVLNNESGFVVPEKDIDSLVEKTDFLIRDSRKRIEMGIRGRKVIEEGFDINVLNKRLTGLLKELV